MPLDPHDKTVAAARRRQQEREHGYREQALRLYPWVCGRCGREFTRINLHQLTVHHRDHNHDHNPPDGSNWELLCLYCHDAEHGRYAQPTDGAAPPPRPRDTPPATHKPFARLDDLLRKKD